MRTLKLTLGTLLACCLLPAQDDGINWLENYEDALREAKRTQKPIFLEFRCEP